MAKTIQRQKKKAKKPESVNSDTNVNQGTNQNVVKVVIEHPKPEPEKPKPKRRAKPRVDKAKEEAIGELKESLSEYDEAQKQADARGIKIPMDLGVSPIEAGEVKNTADILQFASTIREKTAKIRELKPPESEGRKLPAAPARINPFLTPPAQMAPTVFPSQPMAPIRPGTGSTPVPPSTAQPEIPQVPLPEIEKGFDDLEEALGQSAAEDEFRKVLERIEPAILGIRDEVEQTYLQQNNTLSDTQVRAFKGRYELQRNSLIDAFAALSKAEQSNAQPKKDAVEELINRMTERLGEIERASDPGLSPGPAPPPSYQQVNKELDIEAYNRLVRYVKDGRISWKPSLSDDLRRLNVPEEEIRDINSMSTTERKEILRIILGLEDTPPRRPPRPQPQPARDPRPALIAYVNDPDMDWNDSLFQDLKDAGASLQVQNAVSETALESEKKDIVRKFLGLSPSPGPSPPSSSVEQAKQRLMAFVTDEDMDWSTGLEADLQVVAPLQIQNQVNESPLDDDKRAVLERFFSRILPQDPSVEYQSAVAEFNRIVTRIGGSYRSADKQKLEQQRDELNNADQLVDEKFRDLPTSVQTTTRNSKNILNDRYRDLLSKIQQRLQGFSPSHADILNREPQNPTEAFALLRAYVAMPEAVFNDYVGVALDLTFGGERERVFNLPTEAEKKARVKRLLDSSGQGPSLAPGQDPGGQPRPPPFQPGGLQPGSGRRTAPTNIQTF